MVSRRSGQAQLSHHSSVALAEQQLELQPVHAYMSAYSHSGDPPGIMPGTSAKRHMCSQLLTWFYVAWLCINSFGYWWFQFYPPGVEVSPSIPVPQCTSCFCTERFNSTDVVVAKDIQYKRTVDTHQRPITLTMDMYRAKQGVHQAPAIVLIHGGGFIFGSKDESIVVPEAMGFARRGFVAFCINYRLEGSFGSLPRLSAFYHAISDAKAAVRFIKENAISYKIDPHRVALFGSSAGAIIAASMPYVQDDKSDSNPINNSRVSARVGISGTIWPFLLTRDHSRTVQQPDMVPWFDIHGEQDLIVPPFMAKMTHLYLEAKGWKASNNRLEWVRGGGHVPWLPWYGSHVPSGAPTGLEPRRFLEPHIVMYLVKSLGLGELLCKV